MSELIAIVVPAVMSGEATPIGVVIYESDTVESARTLRTSTTLEALGATGTPNEELLWSADVDPAKYNWLSLVSADNAMSQAMLLFPKIPTEHVDVFIDTATLIGEAIEGIRVVVEASNRANVVHTKVLLRSYECLTDASGQVTITLLADSGSYKITVDETIQKTISTTGVGGQTLIFAAS